MPAKGTAYTPNFLKQETSTAFADFFKSILFKGKLSYGCRVFLLSLATLPIASEYSDRKHGRRFGISGKQIHLWRKEAEKNHVQISFRNLY